MRYDGARLASKTRYHWRVHFWDGAGNASGWSEPAWFETRVLHPWEWSVRWIGTPAPLSKKDESALYLRGSLSLEAEAVRARAYVSALGWYRLFINGADLTGNALVPRWTPYDEIVEYQTYDVGGAMQRTANLAGPRRRAPSERDRPHQPARLVTGFSGRAARQCPP